MTTLKQNHRDRSAIYLIFQCNPFDVSMLSIPKSLCGRMANRMRPLRKSGGL